MLQIFIVSSYLMFSLGLENLLRQDKEIKILGQETDRERAIRKIEELQPDIVIVYADDSQIGSRSFIIEILRINPSIKVIGLSLQNNTFYIYQVKQGETSSVDDLFKTLKEISRWRYSSASEIEGIGQRDPRGLP